MTINYLEKITEVYVFASEYEGGEGIIGQPVEMDGQPIFMPFVCVDKARMEYIKPMAKMIAEHTGKRVKLIRLSAREELEEYDGSSKS
jgi:hypothetical protein